MLCLSECSNCNDLVGQITSKLLNVVSFFSKLCEIRWLIEVVTGMEALLGWGCIILEGVLIPQIGVFDMWNLPFDNIFVTRD